MGAVEEILSQIPISQLADQLGVDEESAEQAARQAVPALLSGLQANAQDPAGAASLEKALGQHSADPFAGLDLASVDTKDGDAIVGHVFGDNRDQVLNALGGDSAGGGLMSKLMPMLAPLVLSWLAGKFLGGQGQTASAGEAAGSSGGLDDLIGGAAGAGSAGGLGDLLGGGAGGGIGDLLGGLLGGGGSGGSGSDAIGDLLGGLLGGGRKG